MYSKDSGVNTLKGFIFEHELLNMLKNHQDFSIIQHEVINSNADIKVDYQGETLLIECKANSTFSSDRFNQVLKQLSSYSKPPHMKRVLAFPGKLSSIQIAKLTGYYWLQVWDIYKLAQMFAQQINLIQSEELRQLLISANSSNETVEDNLLIQLINCTKGSKQWSVYQKICASILEHLFCPRLGKPIIELSDYVRANRRDIIMANYCDEGFWKFLRDRYRADYIIIDAKNHSSKADKNFVLQMANYLKDYGPGMFGIITSRTVPKESAIHTQREVWMAQNKLIIFINDIDFEQMLMLKKNGNNPEEVIKQKIEDFRLRL